MPSEIEVARGLVADEQGRAVDHGAGHGDALLLAAGELVREVVHALGEADEAEHLGHLGLDDRLGLADALEGKGDVLVDGLVRQELEVLVDGADLATKIRDLLVAHLGEVLSGHDDLTGAGLQLARDEAQKRRLAGARVTDDEHELAGVDVEADVVECGLVGLGRVDECDVFERHGRGAGARNRGSGIVAGKRRVDALGRRLLDGSTLGLRGGDHVDLLGDVRLGLILNGDDVVGRDARRQEGAGVVRAHGLSLRSHVGHSVLRLLHALRPLSLSAAKVTGHRSSLSC